MTWGNEFGGSVPTSSIASIISQDDPISHFGAVDSPDGESFLQAFDGDPNTKYLNFNRFTSGMTVTAFTPIQLYGIALTAANDEELRDPFGVLIFGVNEDSSTDLLATLAPPSFNRFERKEFFLNTPTEAYLSFRIILTDDPAADANSLQVAEIEFLGAPADRSLRILESSNSRELFSTVSEVLTNITTLTWLSEPDQFYAIEESNTLNGDWVLPFARTQGTGFRTTQRTFTTATEQKKFFRIREVED